MGNCRSQTVGMEGPHPPAVPAVSPGWRTETHQEGCRMEHPPPACGMEALFVAFEACLEQMPGDEESPLTQGSWRRMMEVLEVGREPGGLTEEMSREAEPGLNGVADPRRDHSFWPCIQRLPSVCRRGSRPAGANTDAAADGGRFGEDDDTEEARRASVAPRDLRRRPAAAGLPGTAPLRRPTEPGVSRSVEVSPRVLWMSALCEAADTSGSVFWWWDVQGARCGCARTEGALGSTPWRDTG